MKKLYPWIIALLFTTSAFAQPVIKTYDLYQGVNDGDPSNLYTDGVALYFFARDAFYGQELWKLDASNLPSRQLDVSPGGGSSHIPWRYYQIVGSNGSLYFTARDGNFGYELWRYNGTGSPKMVDDIFPGAAGSGPQYLTAVGEDIYFSAKDSLHWQLWKYNALKDTTIKIGGVAKGYNTGFTYNITAYKGKLYFHGNTDSLGRELYYYDPALDSIGVVADLDSTNGIVGPYGPHNLVEIDDKLYFTVKTVNYGREIYVYDGTNPPKRLTDVYPNSGDGLNNIETCIAKYKGGIYFAGASSLNNYEL